MNKEYDFAPISRKKEEAAAEAELKKSSYIISNGLQRKMKMLAAERGVRLNDLLVEAVKDILRKYGKL